MERIAFIFENTQVYWSSLILVLAAATAACVFWAVYLRTSERLGAAFTVVPLALVLSVVFSRMLHWYCFADTYSSFFAAMTPFSPGGFALLGAFLGCFLAAAITRLLQLHRNLPQMLDCMSLAGAAGIALGRLSSFFNTSDRGQIVQSVRSMPWVYPLVNSVSGSTEYRLATFLLQAMVTGLLFLGLLAYYLNDRRHPRRAGDTALLFLLCYGAAEVVLDSTRYDSMYFRSNGFVSIVQVLGAVALVSVLVVFSIRMVKARGFRPWYLALWSLTAALVGCGGYMEYYVQRRGNQALFAYSVMSACLVALVLLTLWIFRRSAKTPDQPFPSQIEVCL